MRSIWKDRKGSLMIEFLIFMPLLLLLWWLMMHVHEIGVAGLQTARSVRECAWFNAVNGCNQVPPQCAGVRLSARRETDDADLHARASSFRQLGSALPPLASEMDDLHGDEFDATRTTPVARPPFLGGSRRISRGAQLMCEDRDLRRHTIESLFGPACRAVGGRWCP
jgi:hypothetical protein